MELTSAFFQRFVAWQVQIMFPMNDLFYQGEIVAIEVQTQDRDFPTLQVRFKWMVVRENGNPWRQAVLEDPNGDLPILSYEAELHAPHCHEYDSDCVTIGIPAIEQVITFYAEGQVNWIDPKSLPWLQAETK